MDKLLNVMEVVATQVVADFYGRGGQVLDGARILAAQDVSSFRGALTPVLWMAAEFFGDYKLGFPSVAYRPEVDSMTGFCVDGLQVGGSLSPSVFMFSDFLRNELLHEGVRELNLSQLLTNFRAWGLEHVQAKEVSLAPSVPPNIPGRV